MRRLFMSILLLLLVGCSSQTKMVEGTSIQLGAYVPWEGNLWGVELCSYVNGCVVKSCTNMPIEISREYTATNNWLWGMLESREYSKTKVNSGK